LSKEKNIYWNRPGPKRVSPNPRANQQGWVAPVVAGSLSLMICLTINYRAYSNLKEETSQKQALIEQIESVKNKNLDLQEDIYKFRKDPRTIKLEAKKLGLRSSTK
jgi:hypothetical protein